MTRKINYNRFGSALM